MSKNLLLLIIIILALHTFPLADYDYQYPYIVWVDKLNLRELPDSNSKIISVLKRDDQVAIDWANSERKSIFPNANPDSYTWSKVKCAESAGWVASCYLLQKKTYELLKPADEFGKAGKTEAMLAELDRLSAKDEREYGELLKISPDGQKAMYSTDYMGPSALFDANEGIVAVIDIDWASATWSKDSRYFVFNPAGGGGCIGNLGCYDTLYLKGVDADLSRCYMGKYALVGNKIIYIHVDEKCSIGRFHDVYLPSLKLYDLDKSEFSCIMTADIKTLRDNSEYGRPEVLLKPVDTVDPEVAASSIYKEHCDLYTITGHTGE